MVHTPLALFDCSIKGGVTITNRGTGRPDFLCWTQPRLKQRTHRRGSVPKSWQLQKHLQFKRNYIFLVVNWKSGTKYTKIDSSLECSQLLKSNFGGVLQRAFHGSCHQQYTNCEYFQRIRNSKVCTKHLLVHLEVTTVQCKQTSERHVALALPRGENSTPWSPTQAQRNQIAGVYHLGSERKKKSVVTSPRLSDNSYPTVPWARNKEALWAMQVGRRRACGRESISNLLISQDCAWHTRTHERMHAHVQPNMHTQYCTYTITNVHARTHTHAVVCTHPFSWTTQLPVLKLLLRQSAALCCRGWWSRSAAHNSRSYLFLEGLNSPTHSTHSP